MWKTKEGTESDGRWKEEVNEDTGESSIKIHSPKLVKLYCNPNSCIFELNGRLATCMTCGKEVDFIPGIHMMIGGKIVNI